MTLERSDVGRIAHLARLAVDESDSDDYAADLTNILDLVARMEQVETDAVEPLAHPLEMAQRLREDVVTETDQRERFQAIAPAVENGLYLVPRVIE